MKTSTSTLLLATTLGALAGALGMVGCDPPECIDGSSAPPAEAAGECAMPPEGTSPETEIVSASAEVLDDGTLVLTWSSMGLQCGTRASDVSVSDDCPTTAWAMTAEIPPELLAEGPGAEVEPGTLATTQVLDLAQYPEIRGTLTILDGWDGGSRGSVGDEPFFVGTLELVEVGESCVTGVLHGFGTGDPDPTFGGPELEGSFAATRC